MFRGFFRDMNMHDWLTQQTMREVHKLNQINKTNDKQYSCTDEYTYVLNLTRFIDMIMKYFTLYISSFRFKKN